MRTVFLANSLAWLRLARITCDQSPAAMLIAARQASRSSGSAPVTRRTHRFLALLAQETLGLSALAPFAL